MQRAVRAPGQPDERRAWAAHHGRRSVAARMAADHRRDGHVVALPNERRWGHTVLSSAPAGLRPVPDAAVPETMTAGLRHRPRRRTGTNPAIRACGPARHRFLLVTARLRRRLLPAVARFAARCHRAQILSCPLDPAEGICSMSLPVGRHRAEPAKKRSPHPGVYRLAAAASVGLVATAVAAAPEVAWACPNGGGTTDHAGSSRFVTTSSTTEQHDGATEDSHESTNAAVAENEGATQTHAHSSSCSCAETSAETAGAASAHGRLSPSVANEEHGNAVEDSHESARAAGSENEGMSSRAAVHGVEGGGSGASTERAASEQSGEESEGAAQVVVAVSGAPVGVMSTGEAVSPETASGGASGSVTAGGAPVGSSAAVGARGGLSRGATGATGAAVTATSTVTARPGAQVLGVSFSRVPSTGTPATSGPTSSQSLPFTGANVEGLVVVGLGAIGVGVGALSAARRRRSEPMGS